ncbi:MAG: arabinose-5-phosphate isomerase [Verrucomicrobia bacterium]|nr:MAG: arabinose-5-phosphate isomerase [Verrucomicrobiota bacterium]
MDYLEKAGRVIELEISELERLRSRLDGSFSRALEALIDCMERRGKVVVCGVGKSGCIGEKIAATLTSTGCPAVVLAPVDALHGDLGLIAEGDVVLALSYSGETEELLAVLPSFARMGGRLIAMTGNPASTLAKNSAIVLDVNVQREACPLELAPTSSTTVMLALGDALAMVLLEARGFSRDDFARFHPGGQIGRTLLLKVKDIMRAQTQMALVSPETNINQVLAAMTLHKTGAAVAVDEQGLMLGIFTHGDFARFFQSVPNIGEQEVRFFVTANPVSVESERLAVEVLRILEKHRVDEVVVLDNSGHPVGMVDSQDLARWRLV